MKQTELLLEMKNSIKTMNHSSERIADSLEELVKQAARTEVQHKTMIDILTKITLPLVAAILAFTGIKLLLPT